MSDKEVVNIDTRDIELLNASLEKTGYLLRHDYLNDLENFKIANIEDEIKTVKIEEKSRFIEITKLVYNKDESFLEKLTTIVNSIYYCGASIACILTSDSKSNHFYIGVIDKDISSDRITSFVKTLEGGLFGNFPGSELKILKNSQVVSKDKNRKGLTDTIAESKVISAISTIPSAREDKIDINKFIQGIEKLTDSLNGKKYCILTISDTIDKQLSGYVEYSLEQLYTQLSAFNESSYAINNNTSITNSKTLTDSFTHTVGVNSSVSQAHTNTTGWSKSKTKGQAKTTSKGMLKGMAAGLVVAGVATLATGGAAAAFAPQIIAGGGAIGAALLGTDTKNSGTTVTEQNSESDTVTEVEGKQKSDSYGKSLAEGISSLVGEGRTLTFNVKNRQIKAILDDIDIQLKRIKECENYGAFSTCTYIMTDSMDTNMQVASTFKALLSGEKSNIQTSKVNVWSESYSKASVDAIKQFLLKFSHPKFIVEKFGDLVTPASLISGRELALQLCFPKKSINGLSVVTKVPFGRNIRGGESDNTTQPLQIGKIYNMGLVEDSNVVEIDKNSLTSHVFVTGSTGSGKSNTIYKILENASYNDQDIHFLVVEPAKGEYKHTFYKHPKIPVNVFGTNPQKTKLLSINPFVFPQNIHVQEHIDRLTEIFNVCWPMYAAMPAVLKNAIIQAYEDCGWDVINSRYNGTEVFYPNFNDVLKAIRVILENTAFSNDNKGDYTGALCTRVESLTNGIIGMIFSGTGIPDEILFNQNSIVDLSRIGSIETKSLIMGLIVLKLQEYRLAQSIVPNQKLNHIVVLEEAHNLLKRTSTEQSSESANLVGKSVEMLTSAIAEMRTYGESFIIVDQSPGLMDKAVVRNTNTKIVLRLPDQEDRELVGKSMGLNDEQITELSKLEKGVAAVYQNGWEEAVLCKFERFHKDYKNPERDNEIYSYKGMLSLKTASRIKKDVLRYMLDSVTGKRNAFTIESITAFKREVIDSQLSFKEKQLCLTALNNKRMNSTVTVKEITDFVNELYDIDTALMKANDKIDIESWNQALLSFIDPELNYMSKKYQEMLLTIIVNNEAEKTETFKGFAKHWNTYMSNKERVI